MKREDKPQFWEDIYISNDTGWDLGRPTPVFCKIASEIKPKKLCIIGCGRGYDAVMFAKNNFRVTAVDFAPSAIDALNKLLEKNKVELQSLERDIFALSPEFNNSFDYVIEQTCFCAIHPSRREDYAQIVKNILRRNGKLIGLWFPLDKKLDDGGPPYGTSVDEVKSIFNKGWSIKKEEFPKNSVKSRAGREKLIIFKKL